MDDTILSTAAVVFRDYMAKDRPLDRQKRDQGGAADHKPIKDVHGQSPTMRHSTNSSIVKKKYCLTISHSMLSSIFQNEIIQMQFDYALFTLFGVFLGSIIAKQTLLGHMNGENRQLGAYLVIALCVLTILFWPYLAEIFDA